MLLIPTSLRIGLLVTCVVGSLFSGLYFADRGMWDQVRGSAITGALGVAGLAGVLVAGRRRAGSGMNVEKDLARSLRKVNAKEGRP